MLLSLTVLLVFCTAMNVDVFNSKNGRIVQSFDVNIMKYWNC
jgi:hypothetical protein